MLGRAVHVELARKPRVQAANGKPIPSGEAICRWWHVDESSQRSSDRGFTFKPVTLSRADREGCESNRGDENLPE
jgi:hypothetical protein